MASREMRAARALNPAPASPPPAVAAPARPGGWLTRWWPSAAAGAVMLGLALWGLHRAGAMANDEVATRWAASLSLGQLAHLLGHIDVVHGAYYLLIHAWMGLGTSPTVLRIPSVAGMVAAVALVAAAARRLTGSPWAALLAGLITALTPAISFYAQTARSYALLFACAVGATIVLARALQAEPGPAAWRWWLGYGALIAVCGYLNELALLALTAHAVTVALSRCGRRAAAHWAAAAVAGALLVLPVVVISSGETDAITWIARPGPDSLKLLLHDYLGASRPVAVVLGLCIAAALLPRPGERPWWRGGITVPSVALPLAVVPAALLIAESFVARPYYVDRYVLYGEAGAALLAGSGLWRIGQWLGERVPWRSLPWRAVAAVPAVAVLIAVVVLQLWAQRLDRTPRSREFDFGGPSRYVGAHARPGDGVIYLGSFFRKASLGYPADFRHLADLGVAVTPRASGTFQGIDKPFSQIEPAMMRYRRIWVLGRNPSAEQPRGLLRSQSLELLQNFRLADLTRYQGITVTLWIRSPSGVQDPPG